MIRVSNRTSRQVVSRNMIFLPEFPKSCNRLLWSVIAVGIVFVCLVPWAKDIYHIISAPMLAQSSSTHRTTRGPIAPPSSTPGPDR